MLLELSSRAAVDHRPWWDALMSWRDAPASVARAQALLARWTDAATWLPPHDLLDRIVAEGQALERFAAAAPPARRALAGQALLALLNQVLALDGARYATPYGLVRALFRRAPLMKAVANAQAVQLLTVHAAKGLEARVVFLLDSDPEAQVDTGPTVRVDWPVQSQRPNRVAFVAQANRCAQSLQDLDAAEHEAAEREELNALYVAMTRAEDLLVVSRTQPHRGAQARSWWARLAAAAPLDWEPASPQAAAADADGQTVTRIALLPSLVHAPARAEAVAPADEPAARLGQAVHRVLEWAASAGSGRDLTSLAAAAAREQGLAPSLQSEIQSVASSILSAPQLAPLFDDSQLQWAGNEVALAHGGDWLRLDRLVQQAPSASSPQATWWVLDYKLSHRPDQIDAYREQLRLYRDLVQRLAPGEPVRAAFITGDARLIELVN
jgi:ATP-dependent helicase/nuclease subunit A